MRKKKGKILKSIYIDEDLAVWIDKTAIKLTKTARGRSAIANESFKFIRAHQVNFEAWWDKRGGENE